MCVQCYEWLTAWEKKNVYCVEKKEMCLSMRVTCLTGLHVYDTYHTKCVCWKKKNYNTHILCGMCWCVPYSRTQIVFCVGEKCVLCWKKRDVCLSVCYMCGRVICVGHMLCDMCRTYVTRDVFVLVLRVPCRRKKCVLCWGTMCSVLGKTRCVSVFALRVWFSYMSLVIWVWRESQTACVF